MSLLVPDDPGTRWTQTAAPAIAVPASYPLDHEVLVEIINCGTSRYNARPRDPNRKYSGVQVFATCRSQTALFIKNINPVPYPLDYNFLLGVTISELPDEL
jgi:hypothetical protein